MHMCLHLHMMQAVSARPWREFPAGIPQRMIDFRPSKTPSPLTSRPSDYMSTWKKRWERKLRSDPNLKVCVFFGGDLCVFLLCDCDHESTRDGRGSCGETPKSRFFFGAWVYTLFCVCILGCLVLLIMRVCGHGLCSHGIIRR